MPAAHPHPSLAQSPHLSHVAKLRRVVKWMDEAVGVPGTKVRVGVDGVLGFVVPGAGDAVGGAVALYAMYAAARLGAGPSVLVRMALNVALDALVGLVPLLGDLFDFAFKANRRNLRLLEAYLENPGRTRAASRVTVWAVFAVLVVVLAGLLGLVVWGLTLLAEGLNALATAG